MLEMRAACEKCETALANDGEARICSFESTVCPDCASGMSNVCPNCGGELRPRPKRKI